MFVCPNIPEDTTFLQQLLLGSFLQKMSPAVQNTWLVWFTWSGLNHFFPLQSGKIDWFSFLSQNCPHVIEHRSQTNSRVRHDVSHPGPVWTLISAVSRWWFYTRDQDIMRLRGREGVRDDQVVEKREESSCGPKSSSPELLIISVGWK